MNAQTDSDMGYTYDADGFAICDGCHQKLPWECDCTGDDDDPDLASDWLDFVDSKIGW